MAAGTDADRERFLTVAPGRLRTLAETVATSYSEHDPDENGQCPTCKTPSPCKERTLITVRMAPAG